MRCSRANVTALDLVDLPTELIESHKRELLRRRVPGELTPTDVMQLARLALFRGLKGGMGAALQEPVRATMKALGAGESTVQASNARLEAAGLVERYPQRVEVEWVDAAGRRHIEADIWAKTYLTAKGLERLQSLGESRRRVVMAGPQRGRVLIAAVGLSSWLLKTCGRVLRMLARRFAGAVEIKTPPLRGKTLREEEPASATPTEPRACAASPPTGGARGLRGWVAVELERLWTWRALTASQAWPALYWSGDRAHRRWLDRAFRELYAPELTRRFVAQSTADERLIQQARLGADADELARAEAAEPSTGEQRRRFHLYGERWCGGQWVAAPVHTLRELKKRREARA